MSCPAYENKERWYSVKKKKITSKMYHKCCRWRAFSINGQKAQRGEHISTVKASWLDWSPLSSAAQQDVFVSAKLTKAKNKYWTTRKT